MANFDDEFEGPVPAAPPEEGGDDAANDGPMASGDQAPDHEPAPDPVELDAAIDAAADGVPVGTTNECSDTRNAERLIEWFGPNLRHVPKWNKWLTWDRTRWTESPQRALAAAVQTARMMLDEATQRLERAQVAWENVRTLDVEDEQRKKGEREMKEAQRVYAHACRSQNSGSVHAMLNLGATHKTVETNHELLDSHAMKLNVANGTLDLTTGELEPHRRADLFTRLCPVAYDASAKCPQWERFLERVQPDTLMRLYLQRIAGYLLTGSVREQVLFFFHGGGKNGKSVFTSTLLALLGPDLAMPAPRDMLFMGKGEHSTREASLHRKRMVLASEIGEGKRLDEALVKDLTGGERIAARRMREDFWDFDPKHKIVISGNHKPIITGGDEGIWRRVLLVPWSVKIPDDEQDRGLADKLKGELPGILAWALAGCLEWQRIGLQTPQQVTAASIEFRAESDTLGQFFDSCLDFHSDARITCKQLREKYTQWCDELGHEHPVGPRKLAERLRERGVRSTCVRTAIGVRDGWAGVDLRRDNPAMFE